MGMVGCSKPSRATLWLFSKNSIKTFLVVKPAKYIEAAEVFSCTSVKITWEGRRYLGGALGSHEFEYTHVQGKVSEWQEEVKRQAKIALTQLHAAYAAFTHARPDKPLGICSAGFYNISRRRAPATC